MFDMLSLLQDFHTLASASRCFKPSIGTTALICRGTNDRYCWTCVRYYKIPISPPGLFAGSNFKKTGRVVNLGPLVRVASTRLTKQALRRLRVTFRSQRTGLEALWPLRKGSTARVWYIELPRMQRPDPPRLRVPGSCRSACVIQSWSSGIAESR